MVLNGKRNELRQNFWWRGWQASKTIATFESFGFARAKHNYENENCAGAVEGGGRARIHGVAHGVPRTHLATALGRTRDGPSPFEEDVEGRHAQEHPDVRRGLWNQDMLAWVCILDGYPRARGGPSALWLPVSPLCSVRASENPSFAPQWVSIPHQAVFTRQTASFASPQTEPLCEPPIPFR